MCFLSRKDWTVFWSGNGFLGFLHPTFLRPQSIFSFPGKERDFCRPCILHGGVGTQGKDELHTNLHSLPVTAEKTRSSCGLGLSSPEFSTTAANRVGNGDTSVTSSKGWIH